MKKILYIIVIVFIVAATWFIRARMMPVRLNNDGVSYWEDQCYIMNTEAGERVSLRVQSLTNDHVISGTLYWETSPDEIASGPFAGIVNVDEDAGGPDMVSAWWRVSGDGVPQMSELRFVRTDDILKVDDGARKDRGDGVYIYANPLSTRDANLQRTDCSDPAVK